MRRHAARCGSGWSSPARSARHSAALRCCSAVAPSLGVVRRRRQRFCAFGRALRATRVTNFSRLVSCQSVEHSRTCQQQRSGCSGVPAATPPNRHRRRLSLLPPASGMELGRYRRGAFLGSGASGDVYEGIDTQTGGRVAIKSVDCRRFQSIAELEAAEREAALLSSLRHRFIVRQLEVVITPCAVHFVMEHAGGGTLADLLASKEGRRLEEGEARRLFLQIFQAVEYCHRRCVVHRDLKPENILLDELGTVKVADFGLASILTPFDGDVSSLVGTPEFMAPDLLVCASCDGAQADMWSLGVMLYEALAGRTPFSGPSLPAILRAGLRGEREPLPEAVSQECRGLVDSLLQPDPLRRITMEQVLEHPWVCPGLPHGRSLSPLPSLDEEAGDEVAGAVEAADEGQKKPQEGASSESREAGEARGQGGAAAPAPQGRQAASRGLGRPVSQTLPAPGSKGWAGQAPAGAAAAAAAGGASSSKGGSALRACSSMPSSLDAGLPPRPRSSLVLQLPGMQQPEAGPAGRQGSGLGTVLEEDGAEEDPLAGLQAAPGGRSLASPRRLASLGAPRTRAGAAGGGRDWQESLQQQKKGTSLPALKQSRPHTARSKSFSVTAVAGGSAAGLDARGSGVASRRLQPRSPSASQRR